MFFKSFPPIMVTLNRGDSIIQYFPLWISNVT